MQEFTVVRKANQMQLHGSLLSELLPECLSCPSDVRIDLQVPANTPKDASVQFLLGGHCN